MFIYNVNKCGSLTAKDAAEILGTKQVWVNAAVRHLGNVGTMVKGGGYRLNDSDMDRLAELKASGWTR